MWGDSTKIATTTAAGRRSRFRKRSEFCLARIERKHVYYKAHLQSELSRLALYANVHTPGELRSEAAAARWASRKCRAGRSSSPATGRCRPVRPWRVRGPSRTVGVGKCAHRSSDIAPHVQATLCRILHVRKSKNK